MFKRFKARRTLKRIYRPGKNEQLRRIREIVAGHSSLIGSLGTTMEGIRQQLCDLQPVFSRLENSGIAAFAVDIECRDQLREINRRVGVLMRDVHNMDLSQTDRNSFVRSELVSISAGVGNIESRVIELMKPAPDEELVNPYES